MACGVKAQQTKPNIISLASRAGIQSHFFLFDECHHHVREGENGQGKVKMGKMRNRRWKM